jgi:dihydroflavonol-4-reductase
MRPGNLLHRLSYDQGVGLTLVTGGAGFLGSHVVRLLLARGDDVRVTVRPATRMANLEGLDVRTVVADIADRAAMRRAMRGVDRVFHVAGLASLRAEPRELMRVNVVGTRVVLEAALAAGVERAVMVSSVAAVGPARRGSTADEDQPFPRGVDAIPYVRTKREAEVQALRVAALGLPLVIANPAHILGRGDINHTSTEFVRRFLRREIPAYVDGALNIVDAEDAARGILLAEERGRLGERYILGNRNFTLTRLLADLGRLSGVEPPALKLPLPAALALAASIEAMPGRPALTVDEVRAAALWWACRSNKAKRELGWRPSHHEDTLEATIAWYREREPHRLRDPGARQPIGLRAAGFALRQVDGLAARLVP